MSKWFFLESGDIDVSEMKLMTKFVKRLAAKIYFLVLLILGLL